MKKGSKSKRYEDMLNLMTLERWTLIFGIGIVLYYVLKASIVTYGPGGKHYRDQRRHNFMVRYHSVFRIVIK